MRLSILLHRIIAPDVDFYFIFAVYGRMYMYK